MDELIAYDVGAHRGEDTAAYLSLGYRVVAVEADPALAEGLRRRFGREIGEGRCTVVECAVSDVAGTATFHANDGMSVWGTLEVWRADRNRLLGAESRAVEVECRTLPELFAVHGVPRLLKVDVEGADLRVVSTLRGATSLPEVLSMESSERSMAEVEQEFEILLALGYRRFRVVRQGLHRLRGSRWRALDGRRVRHVFDSSSSGPPPDPSRGRWLTAEQALRRHRMVHRVYRTFGEGSRLQSFLSPFPLARRAVGFAYGWYDTHAALPA